MAKKNQHVVPRDGGWAVRGSGNTKDTEQFDSQRQAIAAARRIARNQRGEVVIHGRDGRIRAKKSYGNDPFPAARRAVRVDGQGVAG